LDDDLKRLQLRLENTMQDHSLVLVSAQESARRLQGQMQAQCDELQHRLSEASALSQEEARAHVRFEQAATASQAVADILRKHLQEAQESVSEHLQRCNTLEVKVSSLTTALDHSASESQRCKQVVAAAEARAREKDVEIRQLLEKISNGRREADAGLKSMQRELEASQEGAAALQQQLHEMQQLLNAEKARRASEELVTSSHAAEMELLAAAVANAGQQLRAKDAQLLQLQEHANQLQQHLLDADVQKAATQQQLEAATHDISTHRARAEAERSMLQTAHATATSGLLTQVTCDIWHAMRNCDT
jgi:DNA repair exonuclease SbcCD ATPase subunit